MLGQLLQRVQLGPVQDPLAVEGRGLELPGAGADGQEDHVGLEHTGLPVRAAHLDPVGAVEAAAPVEHLDPGRDEALADVGGLGVGESAHTRVDRVEVDVEGLGGGGGAVVGVPDPELPGAGDEVEHLGGRDEGLGRHHVGEHRRAAHAAVRDQGGARTLAGRRERGLVAAGPSADDHHLHVVGAAGHTAGVGGDGGAGIVHTAIIPRTCDVGGGFREAARAGFAPPAPCATFGP